MNVLNTSASGGFFTAISDVILSEGGIVYGAAFDENMIVRHCRATSAFERNRMKGSKYVQSDLKYISLPSTSPANTGIDFDNICKLWRQILTK